MTRVLGETRSISVTTANTRGVSRLLRDAEEGNDVIVERHGRAVAAVVGMGRLDEIAALEADVRSAVLVLARAATDDGTRSDLGDVISALGFDRVQLEGELDAELADPR